MKSTDRTKYLYDYKTTDNKISLEKLILTYIPYIKTVTSKYPNYFNQEELFSVGLESIFNTIITYPDNKNLTSLNSKVFKHLNLDIVNFIKKTQMDYSYELYAKQYKEKHSYTINLIEPNLKEELNIALNKLKPLEKNIIEMRFGLIDEPMTLMEVAKKLNVSFQYIAKTEKSALKKLYSFSSKKLNKFL